MRTEKVSELSLANFREFGVFRRMIDPDAIKLGKKPIEFFRDMISLNLGSANLASFSICRVEKRPLKVDVTEFHSHCGEGTLPLDNDILIHVAPATPRGEVPAARIKIFRVPKGTMVVLHPGVWHHAPFTVSGKPANVLIVLPERTYANDCEVAELPVAEQVLIK